MAQTAMHAVFKVLLPMISATDSGRPLDVLADRAQWSTRYSSTLGSLSSFVAAFEDVFFSLRCRLPLYSTSADGEDGGGDAAATQPESSAGLVSVGSLEDEVAYVSAYTGPVGPWLLYGRVIARFFPPNRVVSLGVVAEALSWGLYFAPPFGDLPSLLAVVGRSVHQTAILPIPDSNTITESKEDREAASMEEEHVHWLLTVNRLIGAQQRGCLSGDARSAEQEEEVRIPVEALYASVGPTSLTVKDVARSFPLLFRLERAGAASSESVADAASVVFVARRCVSSRVSDSVRRFVDTYVCPLLRVGVPYTVAALSEELRLRDMWCPRQHPLLRPLWVNCRGAEPSAPPTAFLMGLLWVYTAAGDTQTGTSALWSDNRLGATAVCRPGCHLSLTLSFRQREATDDVEGGTPRTRAAVTVGATALVSVAGGYKSPQDHLLAVNGLSLTAAPVSPLARLSQPCLLQPSVRPVSLFEMIAESEALIAAAAASADGRQAGEQRTGGAPHGEGDTVFSHEVIIVAVPSMGEEADDIVVWSREG